MAQQVPLQPLVNQSFDIVINSVQYFFRIRQIGDIVMVDMTINGDPVLEGQRCVAAEPVIPYKHLEKGNGNFFFTTENDALPNYTQFGVTQLLYWVSPDELAAYRG